jgi:hypothetical protein
VFVISFKKPRGGGGLGGRSGQNLLLLQFFLTYFIDINPGGDGIKQNKNRGRGNSRRARTLL